MKSYITEIICISISILSLIEILPNVDIITYNQYILLDIKDMAGLTIASFLLNNILQFSDYINSKY